MQRMDKAMLAWSAYPASYTFRLEQAANCAESVAVARDLVRRLPGPGYGRLRRIVRNMLCCYTKRGGWSDDFTTEVSVEEMGVVLEKFRHAEVKGDYGQQP